nr:uncharacterized protein LOC116280282 [Vicugna pacos]XP_031533064.1 uncharacterized protein LOC116280282 [Vicugna pacos]
MCTCVGGRACAHLQHAATSTQARACAYALTRLLTPRGFLRNAGWTTFQSLRNSLRRETSLFPSDLYHILKEVWMMIGIAKWLIPEEHNDLLLLPQGTTTKMILFLDLASRFARAQPRSSSTAAWTAVEPIGGRSTPRLPTSGTLYSQSSPQTQRQGSAKVPQEPNTPVQLRSLGAVSAPSELRTSQRTARDSFHLSVRPPVEVRQTPRPLTLPLSLTPRR